MHKLTGGCHCGTIHLDIALARAPDAYNPRTCDCDYCRKHAASYISDPHGSLVIRIKNEREVGRYRQGGELAEFLLCRNCGVLVGVLYRSDDGLYATVNANVTDALENFGTKLSVSPKKLSGSEKTQRWQELWFPNVIVNVGE